MSLEPKTHAQDDSSQTALYERHGPAIFGYLRSHLSSLEDAEDLLLEVFLAALENDNLSTLSLGEQLAWLRRVAHNKLINTYRRASRTPQSTLDPLIETMLTEEGPEPLILRQEEQRQLWAALQKLPALQQQILQLRYGDGLRCTEISLILDKSEVAVRKLLSRSILLLRRVYQQMEGDKHV